MDNNSLYLIEYRDRMASILLKSHPNWNKEKVDKAIDDIILKKLKNPNVICDNNYIKKSADSTLVDTLDWAMNRKPIIAGNGTFYMRHDEIENPDALMVRGFLNDRAALKKQMFAVGDESSPLYAALDLSQVNKKKLANSYYGGSGAKTSPFYSKWSAIATTASAQAAISTTETTFEAFLVDNFIFIHFNECIDWINTVINDKVELDDWIIRKSKEDTYKRILSKILKPTEKVKDSLKRIIYSLDEDTCTILYWKNNLMEFTKVHYEIIELNKDIYREIVDYDEVDNVDDIPREIFDKFANDKDPVGSFNKFVSVQKFYDPNKVPDTISETLKTLTAYYMKYVYTRFVHCDRIYRLKNFTRYTVTVIDTDSNILALDTLVNFYNENITNESFGRSDEDNRLATINILAYIIGAVVNDILLDYGKKSNVCEEKRSLYNMKNEFYFSKLIVAKTKKRYLSRVLLREGNRLKKPKYDVKGFDFKKAMVSKPAQNIFMKLIKEDLLGDGKIDLKLLMYKLNTFRKEIESSLDNGETTYLTIANAKELEAYDDPSKEQGVKGLLAWNLTMPEKAVKFPAKLPLVKLNIPTIESMNGLKNTYPEVYNAIIDGVFNDKTKIFIKPKKDSKGVYSDVCDGLTVLSIPVGEKIPEWARPYIDKTTIINNVLSPFKSVTEIFNIPGIEEGPTGKKTVGMSNLIRL